MKVYLGKTLHAPQVEKANRRRWGEMVTRATLPPLRHGCGWAFDNGAFIDFKQGRPFNAEAYGQALALARQLTRPLTGSPLVPRPDFAVAPDVVAGGLDSLHLSCEWARLVCAWLDCPVYLVVQDGMAQADVLPELHRFDGLFVGGSTRWKFATGGEWVRFAHAHCRPCHVGRVGTRPRVLWARHVGADSIDSVQPLLSRRNWGAFCEGLDTLDLFPPSHVEAGHTTQSNGDGHG